MPILTLEDITAIQEDVASKDGAVEPLDIRDVASGRVQPQKAAHRTWGVLDEGNVSDRRSSEVFVQIDRPEDERLGSFPFVDEADVAGHMPLRSEVTSPDLRRHGSYHDDQEDNGVIVDVNTMEDDMVAAVRAMRPPSENALPPGYSQLGSAGFDYPVSYSARQ